MADNRRMFCVRAPMTDTKYVAQYICSIHYTHNKCALRLHIGVLARRCLQQKLSNTGHEHFYFTMQRKSLCPLRSSRRISHYIASIARGHISRRYRFLPRTKRCNKSDMPQQRQPPGARQTKQKQRQHTTNELYRLLGANEKRPQQKNPKQNCEL